MLKLPKKRKTTNIFNKGRYVGCTKAIIVTVGVRYGKGYWITQSPPGKLKACGIYYIADTNNTVEVLSKLSGRLLVLKYVGMVSENSGASGTGIVLKQLPTWEVVNYEA